MNAALLVLEILVLLAGLACLLVDFWVPPTSRRHLGYATAGVVLLILGLSFTPLANPGAADAAFRGMYVQDGLALFFKRFFLLAAAMVLVMAVEFSDRVRAGIAEFYALILFALCGMMFAASANDFVLVFVALELMTVTFYVLAGLQRHRSRSLEAGVKYLILGALASAFMVFGIAFIFGTAGSTSFSVLAEKGPALAAQPLFLVGLLFVLAGLGFKVAAFPFQIWAPDVYQGAPVPVTAFLAVGSKAAGFVLLLRTLFVAVPAAAPHWEKLLMVVSAVTILYGNLCAIPQRNLKRLLGYSSIANAGYLLLGFVAASTAGTVAVLYYLGGYLFTTTAAFTVICLVARQDEDEDLGILAGLNQRSPFLAATMTLAMVSLAGVPPLAGFFGKFLLLKAVVEKAATSPACYWLLAAAVGGVVISIYYYFGVIRAIYWSGDPSDRSPIPVPKPVAVSLWVCVTGMLGIGLFPGPLVNWAGSAVRVFLM